MLRRRRNVLKNVKKIDAYPKTSEDLTEKTTSGGTISVVTYILLALLLAWECSYYLETKFSYKFHPDVEFQEKLKINVDVTVAMLCQWIGADILDVTGQHMMSHTELSLEDTWFELDKDQLAHFQGVQRVNSYLRNEFHAIQDVLWKSGYIDIFGGIPSRRVIPDREKDACRVSGTVTLNKVAGNLHVTAGKSIMFPQGHAHLAIFMDEKDYNFSHRINKLSFGDPAPGIIHPLEGDEQVSNKNMMSYQYFITVVPTKVNTYRQYGNTFQYSVSEQGREIAHSKGSHGSPGIYFKYDVSALQVEVIEEHEPFLQFVTRLVGIVGGIFTCSGMLHRLFGVIFNLLFCRWHKKTPEEERNKGRYVPQRTAASAPGLSSSEPLIPAAINMPTDHPQSPDILLPPGAPNISPATPNTTSGQFVLPTSLPVAPIPSPIYYPSSALSSDNKYLYDVKSASNTGNVT